VGDPTLAIFVTGTILQVVFEVGHTSIGVSAGTVCHQEKGSIWGFGSEI
jgi:hypothetical protein